MTWIKAAKDDWDARIQVSSEARLEIEKWESYRQTNHWQPVKPTIVPQYELWSDASDDIALLDAYNW